MARFTQFKVGNSGVVVDPMTSMKAFDSFDFDQCYERAKPGELNGIHIKVIHMNDLLKEKESTNRTKDQADIIHLREMKKNQKED